MEDNAKKLLAARIDDLLAESDRGYTASSSFLDPAELFFSLEYAKRTGIAKRVFPFGGYDEAERKCLFFLPEYLCDIGGESANVSELIKEDIKGSISALKITGSGYKILSHRDYLGAILNLGINRSAIGDICVTDEKSAVVFASPGVARLISGGCERIGSDKVKIEDVDVFESFSFERKTKAITDTVASDRLDCVVSALISVSRDKAKSLILCGLVELNYSSSTHTDTRIQNGDTVTVRGSGKFIISDITEETKKGRLRLSAKKYV